MSCNINCVIITVFILDILFYFCILSLRESHFYSNLYILNRNKKKFVLLIIMETRSTCIPTVIGSKITFKSPRKTATLYPETETTGDSSVSTNKKESNPLSSILYPIF